MFKRRSNPEDPQPLEDDMIYQEPGKDTPLKYNSAESQLGFKQRSNVKVNPQSALARIKPLMPNILDSLAIQSVHRYAGLRKKSGYKWKVVQEL